MIMLQSSNWELLLGDAAILPIHQDCDCVITIFQTTQVVVATNNHSQDFTNNKHW